MRQHDDAEQGERRQMKKLRVRCAAKRYEWVTTEIEEKESLDKTCETAIDECIEDDDWDLGKRYGEVFIDCIEIIEQDGKYGREVEIPNKFLEEEGTHPMRDVEMKVQIKITDPRLGNEWPMPKYETTGSAAMDVRACIDKKMDLEPGENAMISTGFAIHIGDPQVAAILLPRSGLATKHGLVLANLVGLVDSDYQGAVTIAAWNRGKRVITIEPGTRIAQMTFVPVKRVELVTTDEFERSERAEGGFGHTGAE